MERKYFWVNIIIALIVFVLVSIVESSPIIAAGAALVYLLAVCFMEDLHMQGEINANLDKRMDLLEKRIAELEENQVGQVKYSKRGKPRLITSPGNDTNPPVENIRIVTSPEEEQDAIRHGQHYVMESQRYRKKVDTTESDEAFETRVKMEMSTVAKPNIQDLD